MHQHFYLHLLLSLPLLSSPWSHKQPVKSNCVSAFPCMLASNPVGPTIIIPWIKHHYTTMISGDHRCSQASVCLSQRAVCGSSHTQCPSKSHSVLPALSEGLCMRSLCIMGNAGHAWPYTWHLKKLFYCSWHLKKLFHSIKRPVVLFQLFSYTQMYPFNYD